MISARLLMQQSLNTEIMYKMKIPGKVWLLYQMFVILYLKYDYVLLSLSYYNTELLAFTVQTLQTTLSVHDS